MHGGAQPTTLLFSRKRWTYSDSASDDVVKLPKSTSAPRTTRHMAYSARATCYNVTSVIGCIDHDRSDVLPGGLVKRPAFKDSAIPIQAAVFKDVAHRSGIYVNDAAKSELEKRIAESGITGMSFRKA